MTSEGGSSARAASAGMVARTVKNRRSKDRSMAIPRARVGEEFSSQWYHRSRIDSALARARDGVESPMQPMRYVPWFWLVVAVAGTANSADGQNSPLGVPSLEQQLRSESPEALARAARVEGDPARGALVYYRPYLACTRCHVGDDGKLTLGPDLAT